MDTGEPDQRHAPPVAVLVPTCWFPPMPWISARSPAVGASVVQPLLLPLQTMGFGKSPTPARPNWWFAVTPVTREYLKLSSSCSLIAVHCPRAASGAHSATAAAASALERP